MAGDEEWHYSVGGQRYGPVSTDELGRLARSGQLAEDDLVWKEGMTEWKEAARVKGLFPEASRGAPPDLPGGGREPRSFVPVPTETSAADRRAFIEKKTIAGVLAILLGSFGIHKFILGLTQPGAIMLGVTLMGMFGGFVGLFCFITLPLLAAPTVMGVIGIVEGILYLQKPDAEFYQLYAVEKKGWF